MAVFFLSVTFIVIIIAVPKEKHFYQPILVAEAKTVTDVELILELPQVQNVITQKYKLLSRN